MLLDIQAAQAVASVKLFERAVNDAGPWSIRVGETVEWAVRVRTQSGVIFIAHFEPGTEGDVAWLRCGGREVSSREIDTDPRGFAVEWKIMLTNEPVRV